MKKLLESCDYLVIGSNSFSGSSLINFIIKKKKNVLGISRSDEKEYYFLEYKNFDNYQKNFKFIKIDINKDTLKLIDIIKKYKIKYIFNFASQSMVSESWINPLDWYNTNVISLIKLFEKLKYISSIKKIIHFSTPEVYGSTKKYLKENFNFNPSTPYALSRATSDLHLKFLFEQNSLPIIFTRAANVYGEYQPLYRIIPRTIFYIKKGLKLRLHGGGKSKRSFIHTHDVNKAIWKILNRGSLGHTYHISSSSLISVKSLINKICNKMSYNFNDLVEIEEDRKGKDMFYKLDSSKIIKELKWNQKISLDYGINSTIKWIDTNYSLFKNKDLFYKHKK